MEFESVDFHLALLRLNDDVLVLRSAAVAFDLLRQVLDELLLRQYRLTFLLEALTDVLIALQMEIDVFGRLCHFLDLLLDHLQGLQLLVRLRTLELFGHQVLDLFLNLQLLE